MAFNQQSALENQQFVFLLDVDNTLLDNDRVTADLMGYLDQTVGRASREEYWKIFEGLREELGYADYLGALQMYRLAHPRDPHVVRISSFLINYPFADRVYPDALNVVARLKRWGRPVILSDGDVVFQPRKVERSGLMEAVDGDVLIYVHKELELEDVAARYPAERYVFVDDKLRLLDAFKRAWGSRVTTVFPRQGHYAHDPEILRRYPAADITVERIGDLLNVDFRTV
jgi:FMN phosphatase YigB (HAD superfamily)